MTALTRDQRRRIAIELRLKRQKEDARKLALMPETEKRRQIRRYTRRSVIARVLKHASLFKVASPMAHKGSLKVLFVSASDYAFLGYSLAKSLKAVDVQAVAVSNRYSPLKPKSEQGQVYEWNEVLNLVRKTYVIIWMHSLYTVFPIDVLQGKKCVVFHGGTRYRLKSKRINNQFNSQVHLSLVQTGELLGKGAKNEHWILPPVDVEGIKPDYSFGSKLTIGHFTSHPGKSRKSKLRIKGTPLITSIVESLRRDKKMPSFVFRHQGSHLRPWKENMKRMAKCDIYIESLSQGQEGNVNRHDWSIQALEACALGCITITNFRFEGRYEREYGKHGLIVANTGKELRKVLIDLLQKDQEELLRLKRRAREWVERLHSYKAVGNRLVRVLGLKESMEISPMKKKKVVKANPIKKKKLQLKDKIISDLAACKAAFDSVKIPWVITDGIVLGYARKGDVLPWDTDLDLGVFCEISSSEWNKLHAALRKEGFGIRNLKQDFVYGKREVKFNMWLFHKEGGFYVSSPRSTPGVKFVEKEMWFDKPQLVKFLGRIYPMPNYLKDYLVTHYGSDWKVEKPGHSKWRLEKFGTASSRYEPDVWLASRCGPSGDLWPKIIRKVDTPQ